MKALLAALAFTLATLGPAAAQTVPLGTPPQPGANATANLLFDAMMAVARANATNPAAAQSAALPYRHALQSYNSGDIATARAQAMQALIDANGPVPVAIPVQQSTIPQTSALQTNPFPLAGGSIAAINAAAFVAQARGALAACRAARSPNTEAASTDLAAAERDQRAGRYLTVTSEARAAADLCALPH